MNFKGSLPWFGFVLISLVLIWGCEGAKPLQPTRSASLAVSIPSNPSLRASILGSTSTEIRYAVRAGKNLLTKGKAGPFSSDAYSGTLNFSLSVPAISTNSVLSMELIDVATQDPLALGATALSLTAASSSSAMVEMGSLTRNCYFVSGAGTTVVNYGYGYTYEFDNDSMIQYAYTGPTYDIAASPAGNTTGFEFVDAQGNTGGALYANSIAYMGNGDLVDFAYIPDPGTFSYSSALSKQMVTGIPVPTIWASAVYADALASTTNMEVGDVYCVALGTISGAHAWLQVSAAGINYSKGPDFRFRVNKTLPYYAYDRTPPDIANTCDPTH